MRINNLNRKNIIWALIISFITLYIFVFVVVCFNKYFCFLYDDWDLSIYNQVFRGLMHGKPFISLADVPFLGNHAELTMLLFFPVYALFPNPFTLLVIQTLMLALAVIPLFLIAKEILDSKWAIIFVLIYLFYPPIAYINLNEFHPESFIPFIQFFLFYFFLKNDFKKFVIFMFLLIFAKENMSLILIMFGLYALYKRKGKKWVILPLFSGLFWFLLYIKCIMPFLSKGKVEFYSMYAHLGNGLSGIIRSMLLHPIKIFKFLLKADSLEYLFKLFSPLAFTSFFSPLILLIALPNFLQHLLSLRATDIDIRYFYPAESLAFIFIAAIFGIRSLLNFKLMRGLKKIYSFLIIFCAALLIIGFYPFRIVSERLHPGQIDKRAAVVKDSFVNIIPNNAVVISTFDFLPKLSNITDRLYSFHRVVMGSYYRGIKFEVPKDLGLALINFEGIPIYYGLVSNRTEARRNTSSFFLDNSWCPIRASGDIVLFKKNSKSCLTLFNILKNNPDENSTSESIFDTFKLDNYSIDKFKVRKGDSVKLTLRWRIVEKTNKDYSLRIRLSDSRGRVVFEYFHPLCYDIYPVRLWGIKDMIEENFWLSIPKDIESGKYWISTKPFERITVLTAESNYNESFLAAIEVR